MKGQKCLDDDEKVLSEADLILQMNLIDEKNFENLKSEQIIIGVLNPYSNNEKLKNLLHKNKLFFS